MKKFAVHTETSVHVIDAEAMTVVRYPGDIDTDQLRTSILRKDREPIELVTLPVPVIGARMDMLLRIRNDGVLTARSTTYVTDVVEIQEPEEGEE